MRSRTMSVMVLLLGAANWALAGAIVEIPGPAGARVYLDGERVGDAPLTLSGLATGTHMVKVEDPTSGASRIFPVQSPERTMVTRRLEVEFGSGPAVAAPAPRVAPPARVYVSAPVPAPVYVESSPVYVPPPPVVYVERPVYWHEPVVSLHYGGGHHSGHYGWGGWGGHHSGGHHSGGHYSGGHHGSSHGHGGH